MREPAIPHRPSLVPSRPGLPPFGTARTAATPLHSPTTVPAPPTVLPDPLTVVPDPPAAVRDPPTAATTTRYRAGRGTGRRQAVHPTIPPVHPAYRTLRHFLRTAIRSARYLCTKPKPEVHHVSAHSPLCGHEKALRRSDHALPAGGRHLRDADPAGRCRAGHHQQPGADRDRFAHARTAGGRAAHHLPDRGGDEQHHERRGDPLRLAFRPLGRHRRIQGECPDPRRPAAHQRADTDRRRRDSPRSWERPR